MVALLLWGRGVAVAQPLEPSSHFASLDGVRVHYTNYGSGEAALLFVPGWSCDETVWNAQAPELAQTVRVITVDLPGHGQSDKPELAYTMDFYARSLDAVLRDAGVKFATLVGHSNGSPVVRQFYRRHPEKVRGLVIVDGALRLLGDAAMMEKFVASLRAPNYAETAGKLIDGLTGPMKDPGQHAVIKA
ncbi:MAG: alpha/beta hydrolase, partial [Chthoniobacterales bacterium]|nr:alpha/beta hydrolase [Chthoniobacterales bacterium]